MTGTVLREVVNHCKQSKLEKFEIPGLYTISHIVSAVISSVEVGSIIFLDSLYQLEVRAERKKNSPS